MTETPADLPEGRGRRFYEAVVNDYVLTEGDLALLHETARTLDRLDLLDATLRAGGVLAGDRVSAVLVEARQQSDLLRKHLHALGLEGEDGENVRSRQAAHAVSARWGT